LFKQCCYCFVWCTVYHLSVCRKVNRQSKDNLSYTMPQLPTTLPTHEGPSAFHREFKNNYFKCHNYRQLYRRTKVRRHFTENSKKLLENATIIDDLTGGIKSVGHLSTGQYYRQNHQWNVRIPKGGVLNASLTAWGCRRNYRRASKDMEGNYKTSPME